MLHKAWTDGWGLLRVIFWGVDPNVRTDLIVGNDNGRGGMSKVLFKRPSVPYWGARARPLQLPPSRRTLPSPRRRLGSSTRLVS